MPAAGNKSPRTIETYLEAVRGFAAHLAATSGRSLDQARCEDVEAWIAVLLERWKPATAHNRYRGLHAFYRWLEEEDDLASPLANLRVAVTQRVQQDGQWRDADTSSFKVNVWRGQAENLAESLGKGDRVMVTGRLRQRGWETPPMGRSGRSPNWRPTRSGPASSGPRPRSSAPASVATASAAPAASGRPSAAATSTTSHRLVASG